MIALPSTARASCCAAAAAARPLLATTPPRAVRSLLSANLQLHHHHGRLFSIWPRRKDSPAAARARHEAPRSRDPQIGLTTPLPEHPIARSPSPFYFEAGYAGWAKRPSRPFPPPFFSPPSGSFSDPLSTTHRSLDRRPSVNGDMIRGVTNGDDAMLVSDHLIGTNDGVGQWATRERGHAPLWSRLILHFWALAAERDRYGAATAGGVPDPVRYLNEAYALTKEALSEPNGWLGTTTTSSALLHCADGKPVLYVTQLGDCKILVIRPRASSGDGAEEQENAKNQASYAADVLFATQEQWHYFDCPRQLGTNSPDSPQENATVTRLEICEDDLVLAMSDGVTDNLWEEDISAYAVAAWAKWREEHLHNIGNGNEEKQQGEGQMQREGGGEKEGEDMMTTTMRASSTPSLAEGMRFVAQDIVLKARKIAEDPFAASPFMEKAVEEGLAIEGGKLDDISVVAAVCKRRKG